MKVFTISGEISGISSASRSKVVSGEVTFTPRSDDLLVVDDELSSIAPVKVAIEDGFIPKTILLAEPDRGPSFIQWAAVFSNLRDENDDPLYVDPITVIGTAGESLKIGDAMPICEGDTKLILTGPRGEQGPPGERGPRGGGAAWFDGYGEPTCVVGATNGDFYIDKETWTVYRLS